MEKNDRFGKEWSSGSAAQEYPTDIQAQQGLSFLGATPPSFNLHDAMFMANDWKDNWLFDQIKGVTDQYGQALDLTEAGTRTALADAVAQAITDSLTSAASTADSKIAAHEQSRNHPDSTTTEKGFVRKATSAEAKARSSMIPVVTPAGLGAALTDHEQAAAAHNDSQITISTEVPQAPAATKVSEALAALGDFAADGYQNVAVFDMTGVTNWPVPDVLKTGLRQASVVVTGAGGSGAAGSADYCSGGGSGSTSMGLVDLTGIDNVSITIGTGGAERPPTGAGYAGGASSFGVFITANGGKGGQLQTGQQTAATPGVGGDINLPGGDGTNATVSNNGGAYGGTGGPSFWNGGTTGASNAGINASYGAGGGGNIGTQSNAGGDGIVIVRW